MMREASGAASVSGPAGAPAGVAVSQVATVRERDRFIRLQEELYRGDPWFVPPLLMERHEFLDPERNPFFRHADVALFLAARRGGLAGRIAAAEDRNFNAFHGERTAIFGLYESVEDPGVAAALIDAARGWARRRGLGRLLGPLNLSTNYEAGLLVEGFDSSPAVLMPYNPPWYAGLLEGCGLRKAKDLLAFGRSAHEPIPERFVRVADKIRQHEGIVVRHLRMARLDDEIARIKAVYNSAWERNWGFVPMSDAEFDKLARDLKPIVRPELCLVAEDHGEPVAFSLTVPDVNQALKRVGGRLTTFGLPLGLARLLYWQRRIDQVRLMALGVKEGHRRRGLDAVLILETVRRVRDLGYRGGEISWTLEDNDLVNRAIEAVGCRPTKRYRVYETPVD